MYETAFPVYLISWRKVKGKEEETAVGAAICFNRCDKLFQGFLYINVIYLYLVFAFRNFYFS
jgi:hypothetical protein